MKENIKKSVEFDNELEYLEKSIGGDISEKLKGYDFSRSVFPFLEDNFEDMPLTKMKTDIYNQIMHEIDENEIDDKSKG